MPAPAGPRDQARLLVKLQTDPHRVFTKDELARSLRWTTRRLDETAERLRAGRVAGGTTGPENVWGVGYRLGVDR